MFVCVEGQGESDGGCQVSLFSEGTGLAFLQRGPSLSVRQAVSAHTATPSFSGCLTEQLACSSAKCNSALLSPTGELPLLAVPASEPRHIFQRQQDTALGTDEKS